MTATMTKSGLAAAVVAMQLWGGVGASAEEPAPAPAPIAAEILFQDELIGGVAMSPDGTRLAASVNDDEDRVVVIDLEEMKSVSSIGFGNVPVRSVAWASEDRLLVGVDLLDGEYRVGQRILSVDTRNGEMATMFDGENSALRRNRWLGRVAHMLPDDADHVLMMARDHRGNHLWRVNVATGAADIVEEGRKRTFAWFTDRRGDAVLRIDVSRSWRKLYVYARQDDGDWDRIRKIRLGRDDDEDRDFWPVAPAEEEGLYYVLAHPDDEEFATIKVYDVENDAFVRTEIAADGADVRAAITSAKTGDLLGARVVRDRVETVLLDKTAQAHINGLDAYFENDANISVWGSSADGRYALLYVSAPTNPGELWVYDYDKARVDYLMDKAHPIERGSLGVMEIMDYTARDGTPLQAYVTHPPGVAPDAAAPLVVLVHGGPRARDVYDFNHQVQYLASRGYRVVQPYFRGSSGKGRDFTEAGHKEWGGLMQDDVTDAVRHVQAAGMATPDRTCIVGSSYGGYAALMGGATTPDLYACVASRAGVTGLRDQLRFDRKEHGHDSDVYTFWLETMGHPRDDSDKLDRTSPIAYAATYPLPVHLAHGDRDRNVPVDQSRDMAKALKKAGRPVEYVEYEGEGHSFYEWETEQAYAKALSAFLAEHIGGQP